MAHKINTASTIIFIMVLSFFCRAQNDFLGHNLQFTPKERPARSLDQAAYRSTLLKKYDSLISNKYYLDEFVTELVNYKREYLNSNLEYENLPEMATYLDKLVKLLKFDKILNKPVEVRIVREPSFNAYVYEDGIIYIHIGLLANVDSEAELAAVLSHELGHIVHQHTYKRFLHEKEYLKNQGTINAWTNNFSNMIASAVNRKDYSNNLVEQEEEADAFAFNVIKNSDYDFSAFNSLFRKFSDMDDKYKNSLQYKRSWFYIKTHPNSKKRMQAALSATDSSAKKPGFLLDSALFSRIRQQAVDESLNLLFEALDFDECLETAFKQHLFFPKDEFYLFYLTESTRRLMAADDTYAEKLFISGNYKSGFCKAKPGLTPTAIYTEQKMKSSDSRVSNSIFNKLYGIILPVGTNPASVPNKSLVQQDTVQFLTYKDAYLYFTSLNKKWGYSINNYPGPAVIMASGTLDSLFRSRPDKKTYYRYLPTLVDEYKTQKQEGKILWIVCGFNFVSYKNGIFSNDISTNGDNCYKNLMSYFDSTDLKRNFAQRTELDFDEYNKISNYYHFADMQLTNYKNGLMRKREPVDYKFSEIMPELYDLLRHHHYNAVVFSTIHVKFEESEVMKSRSATHTWNVNNYLFDARTNTIGCYAGNIIKQETNSPMFNFGIYTTSKKIEALFYESLAETVGSGQN